MWHSSYFNMDIEIHEWNAQQLMTLLIESKWRLIATKAHVIKCQLQMQSLEFTNWEHSKNLIHTFALAIVCFVPIIRFSSNFINWKLPFFHCMILLIHLELFVTQITFSCESIKRPNIIKYSVHVISLLYILWSSHLV